MNLPIHTIAHEIGHCEDYVRSFLNKSMSTIDNYDSTEIYGKIGGVEAIVEVDETHLVTRRDERGRILRGERYWVIGGICRNTKQVRCVLTRNRRRVDCESFILNNIYADTIIMSDLWRGYRNIDILGYQHFNVNHSVEFVDRNNREIHTQNIERFWRTLKEKLPTVNSFELLKKHVNRIVFEYNERFNNSSEKFDFYLSLIKI